MSKEIPRKPRKLSLCLRTHLFQITCQFMNLFQQVRLFGSPDSVYKILHNNLAEFGPNFLVVHACGVKEKNEFVVVGEGQGFGELLTLGSKN